MKSDEKSAEKTEEKPKSEKKEKAPAEKAEAKLSVDDAVENTSKITADMTDAERYEILKDRDIVLKAKANDALLSSAQKN